MRPLSGVRIIDLSRAASGPFGSMILGDLGAEIIKIEAPIGDLTREVAGPTHHGESFEFVAMNRSKKSIVLDLGTQTGRQAFYDLVRVSDVVYNNFTPGVMERLGADYETLSKIKPNIIYCSITGFGSAGPYRDRRATDAIILALSGFMSVTGEPGRPPIRPGPPISDLVTAIYAALGVVTALLQRKTTGRGQKIEICLLDAVVSLLVYYLTFYTVGGQIPEPQGSGHIAVAPMGAYATNDGYIVLGPCWPRIARVLGAEHLIDDPRFATRESRVKNREEINSILGELFLKEEARDWLEVLHAEDIQAALVNTMDKVVSDPQVTHNHMILTLKHPLGGEVKVADNPLKMGETEEYLPPPTLGQHSYEILTQILGYSEERAREVMAEQWKRPARFPKGFEVPLESREM